MMEYEPFIELLKTRRSIRRFTERPVPRQEILRLLEAARWAPSNHNRQPWKFLVLEDQRRIAALAQGVSAALSEKLRGLPALASSYASELAHYATFFEQAPLLLVVLHQRPVSVSASLLKGVPNAILASGEPLSVAMAVQNVNLAAQSLGLGSCVMTAPLLVPQVVAQALSLPPGYDLTCFLALGYPAESPEAPRRKNLEHICTFDDYADTSHDDRPTNL